MLNHTSSLRYADASETRQPLLQYALVFLLNRCAFCLSRHSAAQSDGKNIYM